ncbi:DUF2827 family protein [Aquirhabdus parva]|uniref:DUF2827 family protein n=1 Tax=Aquirhabdus parva TaxID=2283318 RepID=UPI0013B44C8B|nr:DUF2827 family protein [Aquirhabdus parva]
MDSHKGLTIGLTVFIGSANTSIWSNGAIQNFVFLYLLLNKISLVQEVIFINGGDSDQLSSLMLDGLQIRIARLHEVVDQLDVLIEGGAQLDWQTIQNFRARGGKVVNYQVGNSFIMDQETVLFNRTATRVFDGSIFDEVWTIPQHEKTCRSYWQIMHRCPVHVLPHIWSPIFLDKTIANIPNGGHFGYQPRDGKKRITIFEPNLNVVKTYHYPLLVCEAAYRRDPRQIQAVYVTNTAHISKDETFQNFMINTDLGANGVASIEDRFPIAHFLALHTDIVVTHQWENELNYLYYDVLYGGYPLIHNSPALKCGYYYESFNTKSGADVLLDVLAHHDQRIEEYKQETQAWLETVQVGYIPNILAYENALRRVCAL